MVKGLFNLFLNFLEYIFYPMLFFTVLGIVCVAIGVGFTMYLAVLGVFLAADFLTLLVHSMIKNNR